MDTQPFVEASSELRGRFFELIDSLSALRGLTALQPHQLDERRLLSQAVELLMGHQDFERSSIFLLRSGLLQYAAGRGWTELFDAKLTPTREPLTFRVGEGLVGLAAESGSVQLCSDCGKDERYLARGDGAAQHPSGSLLCVPIMARSQVLGVLNVYHPQANYLQAWHQRLLELFCAVLGHMMDNHRLMRRMEESVRERTRQLEAALRMAEQLKLRYEQLSNIDELTSLHNRRFFFPEAEAAVARAVRYGQDFSVLVLDIDHFKRINDAQGHAAGDAVLRDIAAVLKNSVRDGDIIARFGGEEFIMALPSTDASGALRLGDRIRHSVTGLRWSGGRDDTRVSLSGGVSQLREHVPQAHKRLLEELIREADQALYAAKHAGRNCVRSHPTATA